MFLQLQLVDPCSPNTSFCFRIDPSTYFSDKLLALIMSPGRYATDLGYALVYANAGGLAAYAIGTGPATVKSVLLIRKQPKQNLSNLGRFIRRLLEAFHGSQFHKGRRGISWR
jgi:hypothetical protein